jgi:YVTN family beta-propeller protein
VVVKEGATPLAWVISDGAGAWSTTIQGVANGAHTYTAQSITNNTYAYFAGAGSDDTLNRLRLSDNAINPSGGGWPFVTSGTWLLPAPTLLSGSGIGYFLQPGNPAITPGRFDVNNPAEPASTSGYEANPSTISGAFSAGGTKWYAANSDTDSVSVVDVATNTQTAAVAVGDQPMSVKYTESDLILVANQGDNTVSVIDSVTNAVVNTFTIACSTSSTLVAVLPIPGRDAFYAACSADGLIKQIDMTSGDELGVFDVSGSLSPITQMILSPDSKKLYVAGAYSFASADKVLVVDTQAGDVFSTIVLSGASFGPSMSPDGQYLYAAIQGAFDTTLIDVVSTQSDSVVDTIDVASLGIPGPVAFGAPEVASTSVSFEMTDSTVPQILPEVGPPITRLLIVFVALLASTATIALHRKMGQE